MSAWRWIAAEASRTANLYRVISQGGTAAGIPVIGPPTGASRRPTLHYDEFKIIGTPTHEMVASTHKDTPVATSLGVALWVSICPSSVPESLAKRSRFNLGKLWELRRAEYRIIRVLEYASCARCLEPGSRGCAPDPASAFGEIKRCFGIDTAGVTLLCWAASRATRRYRLF
jgi:hypothetical protein